jgi:hypothetical protein
MGRQYKDLLETNEQLVSFMVDKKLMSDLRVHCVGSKRKIKEFISTAIKGELHGRTSKKIK